jgi:hypothetical protein
MNIEVPEETRGDPIPEYFSGAQEFYAEVISSPYLSAEAKARLIDLGPGSVIDVECECDSPGNISHERTVAWLASSKRLGELLQKAGFTFSRYTTRRTSGGREFLANEFTIAGDSRPDRLSHSQDAPPAPNTKEH